MARVIVLGAHGKVALLAHPLLVAAGHEVAGVIRNPDHAAEVAAAGATPVVLDVESASTGAIADAVSGYDVVVWSAGAGGGSPARTYAVDRDAAIRTIDAASPGQRFVMVSYFGARPDHGVDPDDGFFAYAEAKAAADAHLRGTSLAWTVLMPSGLTLDEPTGRIEVGGTGGKVSRGNVARVIAAVVDHPESTSGRDLPFNDGDRDIEAVVSDRTDVR